MCYRWRREKRSRASWMNYGISSKGSSKREKRASLPLSRQKVYLWRNHARPPPPVVCLWNVRRENVVSVSAFTLRLKNLRLYAVADLRYWLIRIADHTFILMHLLFLCAFCVPIYSQVKRLNNWSAETPWLSPISSSCGSCIQPSFRLRQPWCASLKRLGSY